MADETSPSQPLEFTKHDNYENWYSNNVQFESNEWDLKMVFGELDSKEGKRVVQQHTGMAMSWAQAKIILYFLQIHVAAAEMLHGKIRLPKTIWPPEPTPPSEEIIATNPLAMPLYEEIRKIYDQFVANA